MDNALFISYSSKDSSVVLPLGQLLQASGSQPFIDIHDLQFAEEWKSQIDQAIQACRTMMVFWSRNAAKSEQVEREWKLAVELGKPVVPILLDKHSPLPAGLGKFHGVRLFDVIGRFNKSFFQGNLSQEQAFMREALSDMAQELTIVDPEFEYHSNSKLQSVYRDRDFLQKYGATLRKVVITFMKE